MANAIIKTLKKLLTGDIIYPITKSNAVYDDTVGRLDTYLHNTVGMEEVSDDTVDEDIPIDADLLGGKYKATDIDAIKNDVNANTKNVASLLKNVGDMTTLVKSLNVTLTTGGWVSSGDKYIYTINDSAITSNNRFVVRMADNATKAQVTAMANAMVAMVTKPSTAILLHSFGTKPTISIPIVIDIYKM